MRDPVARIRAELQRIERELLAAIARARKTRRKLDGKDEKGEREPKRKRHAPEIPPETIRQLGSVNTFIDVGLGDPHGKDQQKPSDCKRPESNDVFAQMQYLQCRCTRGDTGACKAWNVLNARYRNSGGGGGGGF